MLVAKMYQNGAGQPSSAKIHPFFVKPAPPAIASEELERPSTPRVDSSEANILSSAELGHSAKRQKTDHATDENVSAVPGAVEPAAYLAPPTPVPASTDIPRDDIEPSRSWISNTVGPVESRGYPIPRTELLQSSNSLPLASAVNSQLETSASARNTEEQSTLPSSTTAKVLKLNPKTGTLGSPPKPKKKPKPTRLVCIRFGVDEESRRNIGEQISKILSGELRFPDTPVKPRATKRSKKTKQVDEAETEAHPKKPTHPFFTGKSKSANQTPESAKPSPKPRQSVFMSTPVSPRRPRNPFTPVNPLKNPQFGTKWTGMKVPGAKHPLWPPAGMSRVCEETSQRRIESGASPQDARKSKGQVSFVSEDEFVLCHLLDNIDLAHVRNTLPRDDDTFAPAPAELRVPQKHLESGSKLQQRLRHQLTISSPMTLTGVDDLTHDELAGPPQAKAHPAISRLYRSLQTQLSAFDRSTCENLAWSHKYAPTTAAEILQGGTEAIHMKEWLLAMKVQSVETGGDAKGKSEAIPKKRRRKNKLDDFVVDTDEDASELDELEELDDNEPASPVRRPRSLARLGNLRSKKPARLRNTIVVSGPRGCGKTASVYAIARELGFEIFEINSSSRRSGKDIVDKVGDMTRNHLVQHHQTTSSSDTLVDDSANEVASGKQGVMTSFFKSNTPSGQKQGSASGQKDSPKPAPSQRSQKQSLILLEEADILYDEDKQFWATLIGMMSQSRRPFVIVCNDESLVPLQSLNLHGIFRFSWAPAPLAVDACLLMAANEGHMLHRTAVEALYRSRGEDLRATIAELNFWCQIGVGDRRGGFDWFYPRWPKGCDLDERGEVVRVISGDTYKRGMGWVDRDVVATTHDRMEGEVEVLCQSWDSWRIGMDDWCDYIDTGPHMGEAWVAAWTAGERRATLEAADEYYASVSDADVCSCGVFAPAQQEPLDASQPDLAESTRDDYIIGRTLLEAEPLRHATPLAETVAFSIKSLAGQRLQAFTGKTPQLDLEAAAVALLDGSFRSQRSQTTRIDLAYAFDPIAVSAKPQATSHLDPSVFDRTTRMIVLDVAPWIRGIVSYEHQLMRERLKLNSLLDGSKKRMRNTRSAYSALEGSHRTSTRRERYFGDCLSTSLVMRTGGPGWQAAVVPLPDTIMTDSESIASN